MKVTIAAGGTGGHLFPAHALAAALSRRGHATTLMTDRRTAERATAGTGGAFGTVHVIEGAGLAGRSAGARVRAVASLARGTATARRLLDADALVAFGGYPSVAPVLAARARRARPPIVLHDQNAVLGRANRFLARFADAVATSFARVDGVPDGCRRAIVGNPVRDAIAAVGAYPTPGPPFAILVLGGSLGARVFADIVPDALAAVGVQLRVTQQARPEDVGRVRAAYARAGIEADVSPFFDDVATLLARAHLVIARSGGSTVAELAASGRPSILVPLPIAASDEQTANARVLADAGAAILAPQPAFTSSFLTATLRGLFDAPARLVDSAAAARALARPGAAENLALLLEEVASAHYVRTRPIREPRPELGR